MGCRFENLKKGHRSESIIYVSIKTFLTIIIYTVEVFFFLSNSLIISQSVCVGVKQILQKLKKQELKFAILKL